MCLIRYKDKRLNILKPTGYYTYYQVEHSKILHADYIAFMCFVWFSEETVTFDLHIINRLIILTEVECVYCAIRTESLHNTYFSLINFTYCGGFSPALFSP